MTTPSQPTPSLGRLLSRLALLIAALAGLLFLPAGRLDWPQAWIFLACFGAFLLFYGLWTMRRDPDQLVERSRSAPNVKRWDRLILGLYSLLFLAVFLVCGLDAGRFRWSAVPGFLQGLAWLGLLLAGALVFWALATNTYASRRARIQSDGGETVVSDGPYRYVRHPMYSGIMVLFLCRR